MRTLSHVFFLDPSPVRRVQIQTGIQRKLNFVSVRTIKGSSSGAPGSCVGRVSGRQRLRGRGRGPGLQTQARVGRAERVYNNDVDLRMPI